MKKSKIALAVVTTAILATSSSGLIACSKNTPTSKPQKGVYEITFDANSGEFAGGDRQVKLKTENGVLASFPSAPTRDDYSFVGWTLTFGGTETFALSHVFSGNQTVYAVWESGSQPGSTYTITMDANGGTLVGSSTLTTGTDGKLAALPATPTHATDTFNGWWTAATGGLQVTTSYVFNSNGTIYAHWTPAQAQEHTITLDANGGMFAGGATTTSLLTSGGVLKNLPTPTHATDTFNGWWTEATGGTRVTATTAFSGDDTIYAHWESGGQPIARPNTLSVGGVEYDLTDNSSHSEDWIDGRDREFMIEGVSVSIGDELSFKIDGEPVTFYVEGESKGIDKSVTSDLLSSVNATKTCSLQMYLKHYPAGTSPACWTLYATDGSTEPEPIPETTATAIVGSETKNMTVTNHEPALTNGFMDVEIALTNVQIEEGVSVSFKYDGNAVAFGYYQGDSPAVTATLASGKASSVTTLASGKYSFYLKHYTAENSGGEHWYIIAKLDVKQSGLIQASALTADDWYLTGDMCGNFGDLYTKYHMTKETDQYKIEVELPAFTSLKIVNGTKATWVGGYDTWVVDKKLITDGYLLKGDNLTVLQAGKYGFYYKKTDGQVFVSLITEETPDPTPAAATVNGIAMTLNTEPSEDTTIAEEYMLKGQQFEANTTLAFKLDGEAVAVSSIGGSTDIVKTGSTIKTGAKSGKYDLYLKHKTDGSWEVYGERIVDPSEITRPADTVEVGNAYLVGKLDGSDATFGGKGFKMEGSGDVYTIEMELTTEDTFKFIYQKDAETAVWVGSFSTLGIDEYITFIGNDKNIQVRKNGTYKFSVDFSTKKIELLKTPDGEFVVDSDVVPDNGIKVSFSNGVTVTVVFELPAWDPPIPEGTVAKLHMWGTGITGFPKDMNGQTLELGFATSAINGWQIQFKGNDGQMKYSVNLDKALFVDGAVLNYSLTGWNGANFTVG